MMRARMRGGRLRASAVMLCALVAGSIAAAPAAAQVGIPMGDVRINGVPAGQSPVKLSISASALPDLTDCGTGEDVATVVCGKTIVDVQNLPSNDAATAITAISATPLDPSFIFGADVVTVVPIPGTDLRGFAAIPCANDAGTIRCSGLNITPDIGDGTVEIFGQNSRTLSGFRSIDVTVAGGNAGGDADCADEAAGGAPGGAPTQPGAPIIVPPPPPAPAPTPPAPNVIGTTPPPGYGPRAVTFQALDECDREALGVPEVTAKRKRRGKAKLVFDGAPAGWELRILGAKRRAKLTGPGSGRILRKVRASDSPAAQAGATVKLPAKIKFVRAFWTRAGEQPIAGPIAAVRGG